MCMTVSTKYQIVDQLQNADCRNILEQIKEYFMCAMCLKLIQMKKNRRTFTGKSDAFSSGLFCFNCSERDIVEPPEGIDD